VIGPAATRSVTVLGRGDNDILHIVVDGKIDGWLLHLDFLVSLKSRLL